jgi:hypothetical protein
MGETHVPGFEPEPEPEPQVIMTDGMSPVIKPTSFEKEYNLRGISSVEQTDNRFKMPEVFKASGTNAEGPEEEGTREEWLEKVDLRRAVIYAEILNRPYV